jgi:hypothetical protein
MFVTPHQPAITIVASECDLAGFGQFVSKAVQTTPAPQSSLTKRHLNTSESVVKAIGRLEADWDGYGAQPISSVVCVNAQRFLAVSPIEMLSPEITPTSNGTMDFEWTSGDAAAYLEIGRTRYSGHIQPKYGETVYLSGTLTDPVGQDSGIQQALALISGLLHGTSSPPSFAQGVQITQSTF